MEELKTHSESQQRIRRGSPPPPFIETMQHLLFQFLALLFNHVGQSIERDLQAEVIKKQEVERVMLISDSYGAPVYQQELTMKTKDGRFRLLVSQEVSEQVDLNDVVEARYYPPGHFTPDLKGVTIIIKS
ncbi:MAG: hypothetical protein WD552_02975 [Candidatus Paceibacterota bacterium]